MPKDLIHKKGGKEAAGRCGLMVCSCVCCIHVVCGCGSLATYLNSHAHGAIEIHTSPRMFSNMHHCMPLVKSSSHSICRARTKEGCAKRSQRQMVGHGPSYWCEDTDTHTHSDIPVQCLRQYRAPTTAPLNI